MARKTKAGEPGEIKVAGLVIGPEERFLRRKGWFRQEWARQEANRYQMALDEDYYDSIQWLEQEAQDVRDRGQNPIVFNEIKPTIDWLIGTERRMRRDFKVLARHSRDPAATDDAEIKTQLLKYLDDVGRAPFERSQAVDDMLKAGIGWLEVGLSDDDGEEPIYCRASSWREHLHDSLGERRDLTDHRYHFRFKEVDLDWALALFPGKETELERASTGGLGGDSDEGWTGMFPSMGMNDRGGLPARYVPYDPSSWLDSHRKRVLLIECWNYEFERQPDGRVLKKMWVSIMTRLATIWEGPSPYRHGRYPFVPLWCYRRKKDGAPYSPIRPLRGPQDDLNKGMSKAQFEAASNQVWVEHGAVDRKVMDLEELRDEINSPDGIPVFANGALAGGRVQQKDRRGDAHSQLERAEIARTAIRGVSGVSPEMRGAQSNVIAAKGIIAKQEQGSLLTAEPFDNLLLAHQMEGELKLALIEQFYTEEKTFSVTGERFKLDYFTINGRDPLTGEKVNDVTRHKAAFVTGDAPWKQSMAEAAFESAMHMLANLAPAAPAVVAAIIDLVFEWSDLPNKNLIVQRVRAATGMSDPDKGDSPEQQEKKRKEGMLAQAQFEAELQGLRAQVLEAQAKGEKLNAEAMAKRLETVYMSAQAAQVAVQIPGAMIVADQLLQSVGFQDQSGQGTGAVVPAQAAPGPVQALPEPRQADGATAGIETAAPDGVGVM